VNHFELLFVVKTRLRSRQSETPTLQRDTVSSSALAFFPSSTTGSTVQVCRSTDGHVSTVAASRSRTRASGADEDLKFRSLMKLDSGPLLR